MPRPKKHAQELIDRGVRLALEPGRLIAHLAKDFGTPPETLRKPVGQAEADQGSRPDLSAEERGGDWGAQAAPLTGRSGRHAGFRSRRHRAA
jgi:transposase-like protein